MDEFWQEILEFCRATCDPVGKKLCTYFGKVQGDHKADGSLVTEADKWADEAIKNAIAQKFPTHGILTEESLHLLPHNDWCWVIDPVDGTTNFTRGVPLWGISIGLLYKGTPVFGYAYFPPIGKTYHGYWYADSGLTGPTGSYLNNKPIQTSPDSLSHSQIFSICGRSVGIFKNSIPCKIRMLGVASYNCLLVADGTVLGGVEATPKIWDIAAAWVIVHAAGGVFTILEPNPIFPLKIGEDYSSRSFPCLVTSQQEVMKTFLPLVNFIGKQ